MLNAVAMVTAMTHTQPWRRGLIIGLSSSWTPSPSSSSRVSAPWFSFVLAGLLSPSSSGPEGTHTHRQSDLHLSTLQLPQNQNLLRVGGTKLAVTQKDPDLSVGGRFLRLLLLISSFLLLLLHLLL